MSKSRYGYQQPSFKFQTSDANYDCQCDTHIEGQEKWIIEVEYIGGGTARFTLPIEWDREYVFGWLSRKEWNQIDE